MSQERKRLLEFSILLRSTIRMLNQKRFAQSFYKFASQAEAKPQGWLCQVQTYGLIFNTVTDRGARFCVYLFVCLVRSLLYQEKKDIYIFTTANSQHVNTYMKNKSFSSVHNEGSKVPNRCFWIIPQLPQSFVSSFLGAKRSKSHSALAFLTQGWKCPYFGYLVSFTNRHVQEMHHPFMTKSALHHASFDRTTQQTQKNP